MGTPCGTACTARHGVTLCVSRTMGGELEPELLLPPWIQLNHPLDCWPLLENVRPVEELLCHVFTEQCAEEARDPILVLWRMFGRPPPRQHTHPMGGNMRSAGGRRTTHDWLMARATVAICGMHAGMYSLACTHAFSLAEVTKATNPNQASFCRLWSHQQVEQRSVTSHLKG